jgi:hypothetical protein
MNCSKPIIRTSRGGLRLFRRSFSSVQDVPVYASTILQKCLSATEPRTDWLKDEISELYDAPLMELHYAAVRPLLPPNWPLTSVTVDGS